MWARAVCCNGTVIFSLSASSAEGTNQYLIMMKTKLSPSKFLARSLWLSAGVGCALALSPVAARAQDDTDSKKTEASKPQPTDPVESKKGQLNQADPGGTVKLTSKEVAFVKEAGAGNAAEIKMGELALKNADSQDVKDFAQMMIKDHSQANDDLSAVARNHNIDFPPDAPEKEKELGKKMLDVKGAAFDKAYIKHAVADHEKDVAEYKEAKKEVKDKKLVEYVDKTIPVVEGHLKDAKAIEAKMK